MTIRCKSIRKRRDELERERCWCFRGKFQLRLQANLLLSIFKVLESMEQKWKIHYSCWDNWRMQTPALEAKWDKVEFSLPGCGEDCEDHERTRRRSRYSCVQCDKNSNVSSLHFHTVIIIIINSITRLQYAKVMCYIFDFFVTTDVVF